MNARLFRRKKSMTDAEQREAARQFCKPMDGEKGKEDEDGRSIGLIY